MAAINLVSQPVSRLAVSLLAFTCFGVEAASQLGG